MCLCKICTWQEHDHSFDKRLHLLFLCSGPTAAANLGNMLRDVPKRTAAAVSTSAAGTASMLREARWKAALQVLEAPACP